MRAMTIFPVVLLLAAACASQPRKPERAAGAGAARDISPYCRLVYHRDGAAGRWIAQTSVRTLTHPETGATVTIVSMVHTAPATYYEGLEVHLRDADIVLAEGIGGEPPGKRLPDEQVPVEGLWVRRQGEVVLELLGLEDQALWQDRVADARWVLADMDTKQLVEAMGATEFLDPEAKAQVERLEKFLAGSPTPQELQQVRANVERSIMDGITHDDDVTGPEQALHLRREEVMWRIAKEHLLSGKYRRAAFVYGAWHGPAIETRLVNELGFRLESTCWHDAILFDVPPEE